MWGRRHENCVARVVDLRRCCVLCGRGCGTAVRAARGLVAHTALCSAAQGRIGCHAMSLPHQKCRRALRTQWHGGGQQQECISEPISCRQHPICRLCRSVCRSAEGRQRDRAVIVRISCRLVEARSIYVLWCARGFRQTVNRAVHCNAGYNMRADRVGVCLISVGCRALPGATAWLMPPAHAPHLSRRSRMLMWCLESMQRHVQ